MSERDNYYEELLKEHLDAVEELLIKFERTRAELQQLQEKNKELKQELSEAGSEIQSLESDLERQTAAAVDLTGALEQKFKHIMSLVDETS